MRAKHEKIPAVEKKASDRWSAAQRQVLKNLSGLNRLKRGDIPFVVGEITMPRLTEPSPFLAGKRARGFSGDVLHAIARHLGHPIAYPFENGGAFIREVTPTKREITKVSSQGIEPLGLHTEHPSHKLAPDFLVLLAIKPGDIPTEIVLVEDIVKQIKVVAEQEGENPQAVIDTLGKSYYWNAYSPSFNNAGKLPEPERHPVLYKDTRGQWNMRIRVDLVRALENRNDGTVGVSPQKAIDILQTAIVGTVPTSIYYEPDKLGTQRKSTVAQPKGEVTTVFLAWRNSQALHGRRQKIPLQGPNTRWLRRIFVHTGQGPARSIEFV